MKNMLIKILDVIVYSISFLFSLSSFFVVLSFTVFDALIYENPYVLIAVFVIGIVLAIPLAHRLNRLFQILRLPVAEWKQNLFVRQ